MHKAIQHYTLFITLFLCSSVPSYTNTASSSSLGKQETTIKQNKKANTSFKTVLMVVIPVGASLFITYLIKSASNNPNSLSNQNKGNNNIVTLSEEYAASLFFKNKEDLKNYKKAHQNELETGESGLIYAAKEGHSEVIKFYVEVKNTDLKTKTEQGWTALRWVVGSNNLQMTKYLIDKGAVVNEKHEYGWKPLHLAILNQNLEIVKCLIKAKANVVKAEAGTMTMLHYAASKGNVEIAECLIKAGAKVNAVNNSGETPLHIAAIRGHQKIVDLLLQNKAKKELKTTSGSTALNLAQEQLQKEKENYKKIIKLLQQHST